MLRFCTEKYEQNENNINFDNNYKLLIQNNKLITSPILKQNSAIINGVNDNIYNNEHINQI